MASMELPASALRYPLPQPVAGCDTLVIRPHVISDAPAIVAAIAASLPDLRRFMPWSHLPQTIESQRTRLIETIASYWRDDDSTMGVYGERRGEAAQVFLGSTGLHQRTLNPLGREIGFWIHSQHTGRGLATLTTRCLIVYGFAYRGLTRIQCAHDIANIPSARVNDHCGFHVEGSLRHFDRVPTPELISNGWQGTGEIVIRGLLPEHIGGLSWYEEVRSQLEVLDWLGQKAAR